MTKIAVWSAFGGMAAQLPENMSLLQRTMVADSLKRDAPAVYQ